MSLRQRLLIAVAAALLASFAIGLWITAWQAGNLVRAELAAALATGERSEIATLQDIAGPPPREALIRIVSGFDGSRHVQADLLINGALIARSHPAPVSVPSPGWFSALATPTLKPQRLPVPGGMLRLTPLPLNEVGERWSEARKLIGLLALSSILAGAFCFVTAAWSLRRLARLSEALQRLAQGREVGTLPEIGAPEIARVARSFNQMQQTLAKVARENHSLSAQLDRIAEEERTELARDLHDEVGPLLFALSAWATAARMQHAAGNPAAATASLQSLEQSAAALQHTVRDLLRRLRDSAPASTDLPAALAELVAFWQALRPQTKFTLALALGHEDLPEPVRAALFRVAQEGISNAVRHGDATTIAIRLTLAGQAASLSVHDDGSTEPTQSDGLGLVGLEERLKALGGALDISREGGWLITGRAPTSLPAGA
jgi:two-component system sensor histidine kinase UhpB